MADDAVAEIPAELPVPSPVAVEPQPAAVATAPPPETAIAQPAAPKRKGRPVGSKDAVQRTRKPPVQVRIEPLEAQQEASTEAPPPSTRASAVAAKQRPRPAPPIVHEPEQEREEPVTPRTLLKETARHLIGLRAIVHGSRKVEIANQYVEKWAKWPPC